MIHEITKLKRERYGIHNDSTHNYKDHRDHAQSGNEESPANRLCPIHTFMHIAANLAWAAHSNNVINNGFLIARMSL